MTQTNSGIQRQLTSPGNALQKYRLTVIGNMGLFWLVFYELTVLCAGSLPWISGIKIRKFLYSLLLSSTGKGIQIGRDCSIRKPQRISLEDNVILADRVIMDVKNIAASIHLMTNVKIGEETILSCLGGHMLIGANTRIGRRCRLGSLQGLTVGHNCVIGDESCIVGAGHAYKSLDLPIIEQPLTCNGPTSIGNHVLMGCGVTILDGVSIGDDVCIEPGTLVNDDVPSDCVAAGVPARYRR